MSTTEAHRAEFRVDQDLLVTVADGVAELLSVMAGRCGWRDRSDAFERPGAVDS